MASAPLASSASTRRSAASQRSTRDSCVALDGCSPGTRAAAVLRSGFEAGVARAGARGLWYLPCAWSASAEALRRRVSDAREAPRCWPNARVAIPRTLRAIVLRLRRRSATGQLSRADPTITGSGDAYALRGRRASICRTRSGRRAGAEDAVALGHGFEHYPPPLRCWRYERARAARTLRRHRPKRKRRAVGSIKAPRDAGCATCHSTRFRVVS